MTAERFLKLLNGGGHIVSSNDLSVYQIAQARACHRFYVDDDGFGYAYFPPVAASNSQ